MTLFDTLFPEFYTTSTSYNLVKVGDSEILLELDVTGIDQSDVNVEVSGNTLHISSEPSDNREYVYRGLYKKKISHKFKLRDDVVVKYASVKNGVLGITLEMQIPEEKKPRKIPITH